MYGYQDSASLGKQGGKFGLNSGALITKFEYNPNAGKDNSLQDAIDLTVQVGEREYRKRFFPVSRVYAKGGGEITDTTSEEYKATIKKEFDMFNAEIADIVKCFVSAEDLEMALSTPISGFPQFAQIVTRLVQGVPNWNTKPVDVMLHYQWQPQGTNTVTFLELPKSLKHGRYLVPSEGTGFKQVEGVEDLKYANEEGILHTFRRSEWFMQNPFAFSTGLVTADGAGTPTGGDINAGTTAGGNW